MMKKHDTILKEAKRVMKWNKRRLNRKIRHTDLLNGKNAFYKKAGDYDPRIKTMA